MATIPTIPTFDLGQMPVEGTAGFRANATYVWSTIPVVVAGFNTSIGVINSISIQVNADALAAAASALSASNSALSAQGSVNYQGDYAPDVSYSVGQSVTNPSGVDYVSKIDNNLGNTDFSDKTKWKIASLATNAIGNINDNLFEASFKNSLAIQKGVGATTATRTTTATNVNRYGVLETLAIDEVGFNKNGVELEGPSTNIVFPNNDFTPSATWDESSSWTYSHLDTDIFALDGITRPSKATRLSVGSLLERNTGAGILSGETHTIAIDIFVPSTTLNSPAFGVDYDNDTGTYADAITERDVWVRTSIPHAAIADVVRIDFNIVGISTGESFYYVFPQVEPLPSASSRIPTTTTAATRTVSQVTFDHDENVPNLNEDWTIEADVTVDGIGTTADSRFLITRTSAARDTAFFQLSNSDKAMSYFVEDEVGYKDVFSNAITSPHLVGSTHKYKITFVRATNTLSMYRDGMLINLRSDIGTILSTVGGDVVLQDDSNFSFVSLANIKMKELALTPTEVSIG